MTHGTAVLDEQPFKKKDSIPKEVSIPEGTFVMKVLSLAYCIPFLFLFVIEKR